MEKEQIIYEVCAVIDEMERQKKISMACRLRDLNLPQSEEEQEDLANVLSERVKARHDSFAFNTWYQFLSTYEDALYVAQEIEKRSQSASLCIQKDFTAYYSFAELLLRMDKHTI